MKGNVDPMLAADEALEEEFDDEENKEVVMVFDVEFDDSGNDQLNEIGNKTCTEHIMKREVQSNVAAMNNSSPLQWRNRGKVVLAETENVSLWDVGSLTPEPLLTVSSSGEKISALHVNNTDAELGGGVRQRLHGFLEVITAQVHKGNYAKCGTTAKLPILKLGEYEIWVIRIKQYFQIQDYALWEVIENGDSWVSVPQTTQENGTSVTKMSIPVTAEDQYPDAKSMFAAIKTRFRGNAVTKKTQKTLLNQQYENFSASSDSKCDSKYEH
ncbi:hypothetical protein Tco_0968473 [Tanacetum coccineum]